MSAFIRKILSLSSVAVAVALLAGYGSGGEDEGQDPTIAFCRTTSNYTAGYGKANVDTITIRSITGPAGATVSNAPNGGYVVKGIYTLGTLDTATISLKWGGTKNYSELQDFDIAAKGTGEFTEPVVKTGGGEGNMRLRMASGSTWMFDVVPVNLVQLTGAAGSLPRPEAPARCRVPAPEPGFSGSLPRAAKCGKTARGTCTRSRGAACCKSER